MTPLKLVAFDAQDLETLSACLQDAVVKLADMNHSPGQNQFVMVVNRYAWDAENTGKTGERRRTGVHFNHVSSVKSAKIDQSAKEGVLSLLSIGFEPTDDEAAENPAGTIILNFAGGGTLRVDVTCLEAQLRDLGSAWSAKAVPSHTD